MKCYTLVASALACLALCAFTTVTPAFAAAPTDTVVNFGPLLELIKPVALAGLAAAGGYVLTRVLRLVGVQLDAGHRAAIEQGLERAIGYAANKVPDIVKVEPTLDVKSVLIAEAANYALEHIPDALSHFGITPERLNDMIEARLNVDLDGDGDIGLPGSPTPA